MIMSLLKTDTLPFDPLMEMCQHMVTTHTPVSQAMDTITTVTWQMTEDIHHPGVPTCRRVLRRREIETTNPLGISIQVRFVYLSGNTYLFLEKKKISHTLFSKVSGKYNISTFLK